MLMDQFSQKMAFVSLLCLYFFVRKKAKALLILSIVWSLPFFLWAFNIKPFNTFDELVVLGGLLLSLPFLYSDKDMKKFDTLKSFFDIYDYVAIVIFMIIVFYEKIQ